MKTLNTLFLALCLTSSIAAQQAQWCKNLPRAAYSKLERVPNADTWFEVYKIRPGIFAIYEPHQLEEVISYLIVGRTAATKRCCSTPAWASAIFRLWLRG